MPANGLAPEDISRIHQFMDTYSFGLLVSASLDATQLPFLLDKNKGHLGCLHTHFSRANPQSKAVDGQDVLVVFNGPHAYISPSWYAKKPAVPTWNYVTAKVKGRARLLDADDTNLLLNDTLAKYESTLLTQRDIVTNDIQQKMLAGIVGVQIMITDLEITQKLGQNRSSEDQKGVVRGLANANDPDSISLLNYMRKHGIGLK